MDSQTRREAVHATPPEPSREGRLAEVALLFLRLGVTAFGGPAAHVAIMENEVVRRRRWIPSQRFLDLFGAASLIPGPSSSELAIYLGYERAGALGLVVAGTCFILPAALMTGFIGWGYVRFGALPRVGGALYGIKPVIIAVIVQAVWGLAPRAAKSRLLGIIGVGALVASASGVEALLVLLAAGVVSGAIQRFGQTSNKQAGRGLAVLGPLITVATTATSISLSSLFFLFLKVGAVVFGSGYVLFAFLKADLVDRWHWLTESQLLDAIVVGQVTPGPVFTTATFIGYLLAGAPGAVVSTVGIFLPGFVFVSASRPLVARARRSPTAGAFLDGVNVASLALMTVVAVQLGRTALVDAVTLALALVAALLLLRWKVNSAWLILGGAAVGAVLGRP